MNTSESIVGMSVSGLSDLVEMVTYRQGFKLSVHDQGWGGLVKPCLILDMSVINTYHPENPKMPLCMHQSIPGFVQTIEDFYDWCLGVCVWFEEHESREWFKVNGIPWRDPHRYPSQEFHEREVFNRAKAMRPHAMIGSFTFAGGVNA